MDALDSLAQGQDPVLRIPILHYVARIEVRADVGGELQNRPEFRDFLQF